MNPEAWLECPECGNSWPEKDGRYCPVCQTKGEDYE